MKRLGLLLSLMSIPFSDVFGASQNYTVKNRVPVILMNYDGQPETRRYEVRRHNYAFRVEVLSDSEGLKDESFRNGRPFVAALRDERFAVRLYNPLPVRVAVNLTVDGLNSISGKPSGISDGDKWVIDPFSFITIRGWQVNQGEARRFYFTDKPKSYAKWAGDRAGKDLSVNCGVIGAAYFWSKKELDRYNEEHPEYRYTDRPCYPGPCLKPSGSSAGSAGTLQGAAPMRMQALPEAMSEQLAGTGMGERESNPTTLVDFPYDTGMYQLAQAVVIYYDFEQVVPTPNPFPAISYAPEMP